MPRGYLKHNKHISNKARRGGSGQSFGYRGFYWKAPLKWRDQLSNQRNEGLFDFLHEQDNQDPLDIPEQDLDAIETEAHAKEGPQRGDKNGNVKSDKSLVGKCAICLEDHHELVRFMKNCNHPHACLGCLREHYVIQAQKSVSNYPLKCFYPDCNRIARDTHLVTNELIKSPEELKRHFRLSVLAKAYGGTKTVVHCPECDHPKHLSSSAKGDHIASCKNCKSRYIVTMMDETSEFTTFAALSALKRDNVGINDGWARCPRCQLVISKGAGCDHMICHCGHSFNWRYAVQVTKRPEAASYAVAKTLK